jgi:hypothetical protein
MLVVKNIDVIQVDRDSIQLASMPGINVHSYDYLDPPITFEMIHGRTFSNSRGERICIGISNDAQTAIGLPFEVFESMNNEIAYLKKENIFLRHLLANSKNNVKLCKQQDLSERLLRCITEI